MDGPLEQFILPGLCHSDHILVNEPDKRLICDGRWINLITPYIG